MHELKPFLIPSFAIADASQDAIAPAFGPTDIHAFTPSGNCLISFPTELCSTFLITKQLLNRELLCVVSKYLGCIAIADLNRFVELTQFCIHLQNGMVLKNEMAVACIGMFHEQRLEAKHNAIGQLCLLGQHEWFMILYPKISLQPHHIDRLFCRHQEANKYQ
jgi:hypothetical protein